MYGCVSAKELVWLLFVPLPDSVFKIMTMKKKKNMLQ